jgi:tryptophan halogenase
MELTGSLAHRIRMFRERAHAWQADGELFRVDSWTQVMIGQGVRPEHYHLMPKAMPEQDLTRFLEGLRSSINRAVEGLPTHQEFVDRYARASDEIWKKANAM